jgi:SH3-like domain-containing protein
MSFRSLIVAAMAFTILPAAGVLAQDTLQQQPDVQNSKFQFQGVINANAVYIRSGPGEGYYPTDKIDKDTPVTVVGIKFDWLKIEPPAGSFCYVAKAFVEKRGDGTVGRVTKPDINVRAGSNVNPTMRTTVQTKLNVGQDVQILGEVDEYFKIKPPEGAYLYVNKQFVDPVKVLQTGNTPAAPAPIAPVAHPVANTGSAPAPAPTVTPIPPQPMIGGVPVAAIPSTMPATGQVAIAVPPTTMPAVAVAPQINTEEQFGKLETEFSEMNAKPVKEQTPDELARKYEAIAKADGLSDTLKRVVQIRIATLKARGEEKAQLADVDRIEKEAADKQKALIAEQQELQENLAKTNVVIFAAVGTVQPSSLQLGGGGTLYRLTDPANGRTVVYVRSNDSKLGDMIGQFVGVKGDAANDPQLPLRMITPTDIEVVDPAKINTTVAAEIIPPSMMTKAAESSATN